MAADNIGQLPDLQTIARQLGGEVSGGQVLCPGPGHSAKDRSLSIRIDGNAPDGFVVNSFSTDDPINCKDYVRQCLGLPAFQPKPRRRAAADIDRVLMAAVAAQPKTNNPRGKLTDAYPYRDADGALLYEVLRYEPKAFSQRMPNGHGGWIYNLDTLNGRRVIYRWPELLKFPDATIFVAEGEKDADRLWSVDLCATTVASGTWTAECVEALKHRHCIVLQDNDDSGRERALKAAQALHGTAASIRIVLLPSLREGQDVSDWLDAGHGKDELTNICFDTAEWSPDQANAETLKDETPRDSATDNKEKLAPAAHFAFLNITAWQDQLVPEREWTVRDRIPAHNVTLLSGEGSVGKSILALQLSTAVILGFDWLGVTPEPGPVLGVYCEEDEPELWRRLDLIFRHFEAAYTEFKNMHLLALAGQDALMAVPNNKGLIQPTELFKRILEAACDIKPKLIVLDNAADIFGGYENDRGQVRQFIGLLRGLAIAAGAGVLLTSHPSLTGINTKTGLSGSTAWDASVRSRLYFQRVKTPDKDEEADPNLRALQVMKANYGPIGETITLRWNNGLFLPVGGAGYLDKLAVQQTADLLFLDLLTRFARQGRNVSAIRNAPNFAPAEFAREPEAKADHVSKQALTDAMRRLFVADKIRVEDYGRPSRPASRIAIKQEESQ
jgi:RecA-family ATPase